MGKTCPFLILLFSQIALAGPISDDFCKSKDCINAMDRGLEAALVQTGAMSFSNDLQGYLGRRIGDYTDKLGITEPLASGLFVYKIYRDQELNFKIKDTNVGLGLGTIKIGFSL